MFRILLALLLLVGCFDPEEVPIPTNMWAWKTGAITVNEFSDFCETQGISTVFLSLNQGSVDDPAHVQELMMVCPSHALFGVRTWSRPENWPKVFARTEAAIALGFQGIHLDIECWHDYDCYEDLTGLLAAIKAMYNVTVGVDIPYKYTKRGPEIFKYNPVVMLYEIDAATIIKRAKRTLSRGYASIGIRVNDFESEADMLALIDDLKALHPRGVVVHDYRRWLSEDMRWQ